MKNFAYLLPSLLFIIVFAGCPKAKSEADLVPCAGVVLLDEKPLADATIRMKNSRGNSFGKTDEDGKFRMFTSYKSVKHDGAYSGTMLVAVLKRVPRKPSEMRPGMPDTKNLLHQKYEYGETSGIEFVLPIDGKEDVVIKISSAQDPLLAPLPLNKGDSK